MSAALPRPLAERLQLGMPPRLAALHEDLCEEVLAFAADQGEPSPARRHAQVLLRYCLDRRDRFHALAKAEDDFRLRHASALDEAERRAAILDLARLLGSSGRQWRGDRAALERHFDADAAIARVHKRQGECERALAWGLERLGHVAGQALQEDPGAVAGEFFLGPFAQLLTEMRQWKGDARVRSGAHRCLRWAIERLRAREGVFWLDASLSETRRAALDPGEDLWVQCAAFDAMLALSPASVLAVIERRLEIPARQLGDRHREIYLRRHLARLVCREAARRPEFAPCVSRFAHDEEGAVRQALAENLHLLDEPLALGLLTRLRTDRDPQVRAAVFADPDTMLRRIEPERYLRHIERVLVYDKDEFVLRMALDAGCRTVALVAARGSDPAAGARRLRTAIARLRQRDLPVRVLRWAGEAREQLWLACDEGAIEIARLIGEASSELGEGQRRAVPALRAALRADMDRVGRVMAVLAQRDFGLTLAPSRRPRLQKGEYFRRRLWRIWFELRHPAPDKRQAFAHSIGRDFAGTMIAPSARMAELAPTKVPGEPLVESAEGAWRNYLPLLDMVLSAIDNGREMRVYTSEGITAIRPPSGLLRRLALFAAVSRDFASLAALRNRDPAAYVERLRAQGVELEFLPWRGQDGEPVAPIPPVTQMFGMGGAMLAAGELVDRSLAYFSTVYANDLAELGLFIALASIVFFGRHMAMGWWARRLRGSLSLVLGGWGTRGKSGTERLKAALVNALGAPLVSKTTGCEAMFLYGSSFGQLTEMFLFRPYDKATIWEQLNLLRISRGLAARAFLWECMGLNPAYVRVLQQDWMRDDIATITNTYPDHEDVQGPAGRNIPEVMCEFIPRDSLLLTTEEEMLPILQEGARRANSRLRALGWKQAGLIHRSLLEPLPYEEHPYNIALVAAMGEELGLEHDYCVHEMARRVVADLGVLKTYPRSQVSHRTLEFVMGMSANERFGAIGNWNRMGFAEHELAHDPHVYVTTLVNNRADRVPRSRVFARMLVQDVSADRHVLIGSNIDGLLGFIEAEWADYLSNLVIFDGKTAPAQQLEALGRRLRIAVSEEQLRSRLCAMLNGLALAARPQGCKGEGGEVEAGWAEAGWSEAGLDTAWRTAQEGRLGDFLDQAQLPCREAVLAHWEEWAGLHREYAQVVAALDGNGPSPALEERIKALLTRAFHAKLVPVHQYHISGEELVALVGETSPPGLLNRIMGMQNIKGTGLDWVYRWQAWETVHRACEEATSGDPVLVAKGLRQLAAWQEYGLLCEGEVRRTLALLRGSGEMASIAPLALLDSIEQRLDDQIARIVPAAAGPNAAGNGENGSAARGRSLWRAPRAFGLRLAALAEGLIDASDAVRRRRRADRIYRDLMAERISSQRAASELKELTGRQKGGWLLKSLSRHG